MKFAKRVEITNSHTEKVNSEAMDVLTNLMGGEFFHNVYVYQTVMHTFSIFYNFTSINLEKSQQVAYNSLCKNKFHKKQRFKPEKWNYKSTRRRKWKSLKIDRFDYKKILNFCMLKSYVNYTSIKKHQMPQSQKTTHITDNFLNIRSFYECRDWFNNKKKKKKERNK